MSSALPFQVLPCSARNGCRQSVAAFKSGVLRAPEFVRDSFRRLHLPERLPERAPVYAHSNEAVGTFICRSFETTTPVVQPSREFTDCKGSQ